MAPKAGSTHLPRTVGAWMVTNIVVNTAIVPDTSKDPKMV